VVGKPFNPHFQRLFTATFEERNKLFAKLLLSILIFRGSLLLPPSLFELRGPSI